MIVLDASALIELLLATDTGLVVMDRIADPAQGLHAPHLIDLEVVQVLRRLVASGSVEAGTAANALTDLRDLDIRRHAHEPLLDRIWSLRGNLTAYDAAYVALAEGLGATLLTCDTRLAAAPGLRGRIELVRQHGSR